MNTPMRDLDLLTPEGFAVAIDRSVISKGDFRLLLRRLGACAAGLKFVKGKTLDEAWNMCQDGHFMYWWIHQLYLCRLLDVPDRLLLIDRTLDALFTDRQRRKNGDTPYRRAFAAAMRAHFTYSGTIRV